MSSGATIAHVLYMSFIPYWSSILSVNPAVDIGQVEGALMMGQGYVMMEKEMWDPVTGKVITNSTTVG